MTQATRIDGIVERIAPTSFGHQHGLHVLIEGDDQIYHFNTAFDAYEPGIRPDVEALVALTRAGDHVWFELKNERGSVARQGTLRNWTLEHRLFGQTRPIGDATPVLAMDARPSARD